MSSHQLNLEKLKLLLSGLVDGNKFKKRIKKIRKRLNIPNNGLQTIKESQTWHKTASLKQDKIMTNPKWVKRVYALDKNDPDYDAKYRNLHKEAPINFLSYSVDEIMQEYPDLGENLRSSIRHYILFNSISSPQNHRVYSHYKGDRHVIGVEFFGYATEEEMDSAFRFLKDLNRSSFQRVRPLTYLDQGIKILKLSQKKGASVASKTPDFEEDGKYSDESIVSAVMPEFLDTNTKSKKNKALIRKKRSRVRERIGQHFPKTSKRGA